MDHEGEPAGHDAGGTGGDDGESGSGSDKRSPRRPWQFGLGLATGILTAGVFASLLVPVPYWLIAPGSARSTVPLITTDGDTFDFGTILFLTISADDRVTLVEAAGGWLHGDIDVVPEERFEGSGPNRRTEEQIREENAAAMTQSQQVAEVVALRRLGYEVTFTGSGATVLEVEPGSPADGVLDVSDTIVAVDGEPVTLAADLGELIGGRAPGDTVTVTVEPVEGEEREEQLTLAARPDDETAGFLGVGTETRDVEAQLPISITIDDQGVGGPSAGLAFTLSLLDLLSPGDLTGGRTIAVTGTIQPDGTVGDVGGVKQKAAAAADAGAEIMLVPPGEADEARAHSHGMEIVVVETLDDALDALEDAGGDPLPEVDAPTA